MLYHPTFTQAWNLVGQLRQYKHLQYDWDEAATIFQTISIPQYRRLLYLDFSHKVVELDEMLKSLKLPVRPSSAE